MNHLKKAIQSEVPGDTRLEVGWSKVNITPEELLPIAGYGIRDRSSAIHDSLYIRTVAFKKDGEAFFMVSADLMIFPPEVKKRVEAQICQQTGTRPNIYYSATHTHSAAGGWLDAPASIAFAGIYNEKYTRRITEQTILSIRLAQEDMDGFTFAYGEDNYPNAIANRLYNPGKVDDLVKVTKLRKNSGQQAYIITYSAHATCISRSDNQISGDYPGHLSGLLEHQDNTEVALFAAGAVGSMGNNCKERYDYDCVENNATGILHKVKILDHEMHPQSAPNAFLNHIPLELRQPNARLDKNMRIRPWLFYALLGEQQDLNISVLKIGHVVFIGLPCDFSGELTGALYEQARKKGLDLVITGFNGSYIGYVLPAERYEIDHHETRMMDWYGPGTGAFFTSFIEQIIEIL